MKTVTHSLIIVSFILFTNNFFAQDSSRAQNVIDSLLESIPREVDTMQFWHYVWVKQTYAHLGNIEKVKYYIEKGKEVAENIEDPYFKARILREEGMYLINTSQFEKALESLKTGILYAEKVEFNSKILSYLYGTLGLALKNLGRTGQALDAYLKGAEIAKGYDQNISDKLVGINNIGTLYAKLGNLKVSNEYHERQEALAKKHNNKYQLAIAQSNRASNYAKVQRYQEALELYFKATPTFEKPSLKRELAEQYYYIGGVYLNLDSLQLAKKYLELSKSLSIETKEKSMLGVAIRKNGELNYKLKNYDLALREFQKSLQISKEASNNLEMVEDYLQLSKAYEKLNNISEAYKNHKLYFAKYDSVFSLENKQKFTDLEIKYKTEKSEQEVKIKEKEIVVLEQEAKINNQQKWLLGGGMALSLSALGFGFYGFRQRTKRNKLEKDKVEAELEFKKKELTAHALHLAKKNEVLEGLKQKATELKNTEGGGKAYQELIRTINFDQQDDKAWENFTRYFEAVHKDFEKVAVSRYPDISKNEIRLMALLKMNLSSKEIANILNISAVGVKKARNRLRKKMQLTPEDSLETMIMSI